MSLIANPLATTRATVFRSLGNKMTALDTHYVMHCESGECICHTQHCKYRHHPISTRQTNPKNYGLGVQLSQQDVRGIPLFLWCTVLRVTCTPRPVAPGL